MQGIFDQGQSAKAQKHKAIGGRRYRACIRRKSDISKKELGYEGTKGNEKMEGIKEWLTR